MPEFAVEVCRIAYAHKTIKVEAESQEEAEEKAVDIACNHDFPIENSSEYDVVGSFEVKETK